MKPIEIVLTAAIVLVLCGVGCGHSKKYELQGEVKGKDPANCVITVKHGDIPGFMPAMTMPYRVKVPAALREIQPGDKIAADIIVSSNGNETWLENIRITDKSGRSKIEHDMDRTHGEHATTQPRRGSSSEVHGQALHAANFVRPGTILPHRTCGVASELKWPLLAKTLPSDRRLAELVKWDNGVSVRW